MDCFRMGNLHISIAEFKSVKCQLHASQKRQQWVQHAPRFASNHVPISIHYLCHPHGLEEAPVVHQPCPA